MTVDVTAVNDAPTASNNTVTTNEDTDHTFSASEFGFTDVDGDSLDHVSIETLPSNGTLLLSGVAISAGDQISAANISNGLLSLDLLQMPTVQVTIHLHLL